MTEQPKGVKHYPGLGSTFPTDLPNRQLALQEQMRRQDEKEKALLEKLKARYVEPGENTPKA